MTPPGSFRPVYRPGRYVVPNEQEALEIAVGAILTQNTAWSNVEKAIESLHSHRAMEVRKILKMSQRRLERLIRSSGYFRQKAERLQIFLTRASERGGMKRWFDRPLDRLRQELLSLSGIGPETADSILLYAAAKPAFVVDAYTLRIGERLGWYCKATYEQVQTALIAALPRSVTTYQEFHALVVALAKFYCRKEPLCAHCPMADVCEYSQESRRES